MSDVIIVAVVAAVAPTLTVLVTWWSSRRKLEEVHTIVNSQRTEMLATIARLRTEIATLEELLRATPKRGKR